MKCRVCNDELVAKYSKCGYCGYENKQILTVDKDDSDEYRKKLLSDVRGITSWAKNFVWDDQKESFNVRKANNLFEGVSSGLELSTIFISPFELDPVGIGNKQSLEISYLFKNEKRKTIIELVPPALNTKLHLAFRIENNLRLTVFLGDKNAIKDSLKDSSKSNSKKYIVVNNNELDFS